MSFERLFQRAMRRRSGAFCRALLVTFLIASTGCVDQFLEVEGTYTAYLSMGASFPEQTSHQLNLVDAWSVQVLRPGEGVIAEDAGIVGPEQETVTVELSVTLEAPCELLTIAIELSSNGDVWFRSEGSEEVCAGSDNGIQAQELSWVGPVLGLSPSAFSFSLEEGGDPLTQTLSVINQGGGTLNWTASEDQWWLDLSPTSGSLGAGQSEAVSVRVSDIDLTAGQYQGVISVSDPNARNSPGTASVALNYVQLPRIGLSGTTLSFTADELLNPDPQVLTITNVGGGTLQWSADEEADWLDIAPRSGSLGSGQSHDLVVSVSPGERPGGTYEGGIIILDPNAVNSPRSVAVAMTVIPRPRIGIDPSGLSFTTFDGQDPTSQLLTISNQGGQTLNWNADYEEDSWLGLSITSGSLASGQSQNINVSVGVGSLDPGAYQASITFSDPWAINSPQTVPVTLDISQGPLIGLSASTVVFETLFGANPFPFQATVSNAGGGVLEWQATADVGWIQLSPASGTLGTVGGVGLAQSMTITVNAIGLAVGSHQGTITVSDPDAGNSPQTIKVILNVSARIAPVISNLSVNLTTLNDPTCENPEGPGSRFKATFDYSDVNGDLPISGGSFVGTPVEIMAGFPDFTPTTFNRTATVVGNGFSGQAGFDLCVYFGFNNGVNLWVTLEDEWNLASNQLFRFFSRPEGANSPPQGAGSRGSSGMPAGGGVLILGGSGG
jgi:hypothetical protein